MRCGSLRSPRPAIAVGSASAERARFREGSHKSAAIIEPSRTKRGWITRYPTLVEMNNVALNLNPVAAWRSL